MESSVRNKRPVIVGITGGTGSGKSTIARAIFESIPKKKAAIIEQDCYKIPKKS